MLQYVVLHCLAEIHVVWRGAYVALKPLYTIQHSFSDFQNMEAAHTVCTYVPPYHQRRWLLNWTFWKVSLLFSPEDRSFGQECQIWNRLTIEHFSTLKQSILNELWPTGHDSAAGPCSHMASFFAWWSFSWHLQMVRYCVYWQWFLEAFLVQFRNVNDRIMPMSNAVLSEGPKTTESNKGLWPCPLCTDISPVSLNLLMMLCTVDDEICKAFAILHWGLMFLKWSTIFLRTLSQIGEPLAIFISERLCRSNRVTDLMAIN